MLHALHANGPAPRSWRARSTAAKPLLAILGGLLLGPAPQKSRGEEPTVPIVSFSREVAPLLVENCLACHNPRKAEGGYRVDTFESFGKAGDSGLLPLAGEDGEPA